MFAVGSVNRKRGVRGLTLLEVLLSISLICTTMMAFAMVYPASFRMTRKTSRVNQATQLAAAVADELRNLQCGAPSSDLYVSNSGNFLEHYVTSDGVSEKTVLSLGQLQQRRFPRISMPEPFTLACLTLDSEGRLEKTSENTPTGVCVMCGNLSDPTADQRFYQIEVTVFWPETNSGGELVVRSASVVCGKSDCMVSGGR